MSSYSSTETTPDKGIQILVDADACAVKEEIYRVATRHKVPVAVVSNSAFRIPRHELFRRVVVDGYSDGNQPSASATARRPVRPEPRGADAPRPAFEGPKFDAADDWIAENATPRSVVITADILLAERCLKMGATVIAHNGKPFDAANIGSAIATRAIIADLRAGADGPLGSSGGGPPPFSNADRSRFLQELDKVLVKLGRG